MSVKIKGKAHFQNLEGGFWSIVSSNGEKLRPQMMPVQFQEEGADIECRVDYLDDDDFGIQMWGFAVRIVSFKTIGT